MEILTTDCRCSTCLKLSASIFQSPSAIGDVAPRAEEAALVSSAADAKFEAALPLVTPVMVDVVSFYDATSCHRAEGYSIRPGDLSATGNVRKFTPAKLKMEHHGREGV